MKKSLVLAMAMALGVTASAYAANPFTDVPAGHWAYDSISKLAAAGIIEGYGDDTFRGDRLMTRYEMAQIVAKALAKGANVDRLAAEFADELDALGVRVSNLEKKSDNVKITGEIRAHYASSNHDDFSDNHEAGLRTRLYFTGNVNDNWSYVARLENQQIFNKSYSGEDKDVNINVAQLEGRLGGLNVVVGRQDDGFADGYIYDDSFDGFKASYGDRVYVAGAYGKPTALCEDPGDPNFHKFWQAEIGTNAGNFADVKAGYMSFREGAGWKGDKEKNNIWYVGADFNLADDVALNGMYLKSNNKEFSGNKVDDDGFVVGLSFKGAEPAEPGTWGLGASYYDQGPTTFLAHTIDGWTGGYEVGGVSHNDGFKGWSVGADLTVAKNMVANVTYYDTKSKGDADKDKHHVLWSELSIRF